MVANETLDEKKYLDPVFLEYGMEVYSNEFAEKIRKENLEAKRLGKRIWNLIPQSGFQEKVLTSKADITICGGARGAGKVLPNETLVVTPFGYRKNGDLEVGSILIDPTTGGFERVIQIFEHPDHGFYEITFDDGSTVECGLEHLWKVRFNDDLLWQVVPFEEIKRRMKLGKVKVSIPSTDAVRFEPKDDVDEETAYDIGVRIVKHEQFSVPEYIKYNSPRIRASFLAGAYIASSSIDGTIVVQSKDVADDIKFIQNSLGTKVYVSEGNGEYSVRIIHGDRYIVSYRYVGKKDGRCITVDSPGALYMTKDFVVTHNTAVSLMGALYYAEEPDIAMYGFRRYEADVKRGIWRSGKQIFRGFANFADTSFEAKFYNGTGAMMKMEHLADLKQIKDRFRGAEMPYIVIEELAEFTKENLNVIFDLIGSNRSTTGLPSRFICTCNPVGRSNKLRWFLDWWIDPTTDEAIPSRSGVVRYFCRYGEDVMEIAWGNTPEEVYANVNAKRKIHSLSDDPDHEYKNFITSITFIDGYYGDNKILQVSDPKYMNRISSGGSKSTVNDIRGVWRDVDDTGALITMNDMNRFFDNAPQVNGVRVGGGDIALRDDWLVLWAMDGMHIIDVDARRYVTSETVVPIILEFLRRNDIPKENFAFDVNGIGNWLKQSEDLHGCFGFDNKAPAKDRASYNTRKSECAGMLVDALQNGTLSIEESVLRKTFTEKRIPFTVRDKLVEERLAIKWKDDDNPKALIKKAEMRGLIGHSPDWIEALLYALDRVENAKRAKKVRRGDWSYFM